MASQIDVIATPANGWANTRERQSFERLAREAARRQGSLFAVSRYNGVADLVRKVEALIQADPDRPCLRSLEIEAHANPVSIDDFPIRNAGAWGTALQGLPWCDNASLYLSGCNTGLKRRHGITPSGSIAEELRDSMRFQTGTFEVRLTIFGTAGYQTGSHARGNTRVVSSYTTGFGPWREHHGSFVGARDASGAAAWNSFKNW